MSHHLYSEAPVAHLEIERGGRIAKANDACAHTFNRPARDLVGKPLASLFPERADGRAKIDQLLKQQRADNEEMTFLRGDGSERRGQLMAWPVRDDEGNVESLQVIVLDITEHRRLQEALEESEARFHTLGDSAPVLLWMAGRDGRCTFMNQRWLDFTGKTLAEELGEGWAAGVHPEDFQHCMDTYLNAFVRRQQFRMEYRLRRADGEFRWILDTGLPRYLPNGSFAGYIGSCIDITDFKEANQNLRQLKEQLEGSVKEARQAVQARDEFLSIASHELRTPLSALVLQLEGLQSTFQKTPLQTLDDKLTGKVSKAVKATERLTVLVDSLLDVSHIAARQLDLQYEPCDLVEIGRDLVERMTESARRAGCEIRSQATTTAIGFWDRLRLEQMFENLLSNAIKYGPGKPIDLKISATISRATMAVKDFGMGIAHEDHHRIFDRFERAAPTRHYGGLGLGLYITRQIVEAHGGEIRVESRPGEGSTFIVELPRRPPVEKMETMMNDEQPEPALLHKHS